MNVDTKQERRKSHKKTFRIFKNNTGGARRESRQINQVLFYLLGAKMINFFIAPYNLSKEV